MDAEELRRRFAPPTTGRLPDWLDFRPRLFPSCNFTWIRGQRPILVDTGFGSDAAATSALLPDAPALVFNTHWHSDHVGGNAALITRWGVPVAASAGEGTRINAADPEAFGADWLDQPVAPYRVARLLESGEQLDTGEVALRVVAAAGHSVGQLALFEERSRVLVAGDALLPRDVAFINPFLDGRDALAVARDTLQRIGRLEPRVAVAGHGDVIEDVAACVRASLERLELWAAEPARMAFHACRRVFGFALMIHGGFAEDELMPYLAARRWVRDFAPVAGLSPDAFAERMVADLERSGAARWEGGRLVSTVPHTPVAPRPRN